MYKLLTEVLEPYPFLMLLLLLVLLWAWRNSQSQRRPLSLAIALLSFLWVLSMPATAYLALGSLEWSYPPSAVIPAPSDTIVVLSGGISIDNKEGTKVRLGTDTLYRCLAAARLYKQAGGCRVIVSGGRVDRSKPSLTLAGAMRDFLVEVGVERTDILLEADSATTFENARNTSQMLREHPGQLVFLVTTAYHMRRAVRCFQRQGTTVIAVPCEHQAPQFDPAFASFMPAVAGIQRLHRAFHEWLGIMWYSLRDRI